MVNRERYDLTGTRGRRWEIEASWKLWAQQKVVDVLRFTGLGKDTVTAWDGAWSSIIAHKRSKIDVRTVETNLEKWTRAMDFGKLQELTLALLDQDEALFYDRMKGELPSLQSLSLRWSPSTDTPAPQNHIDFLRSVPPLRQLSISVRSPCSESVQRLVFPLPDILDRHCRSLESLTLKQWEGDVPGKRRPMLSTEEITSIRDACPNLSSLELDIDRTAETGWPLATFDALTEFKNVTNLTLRFELGSDMHRGHFTRPWSQSPPDDACREPNMNRTAAEALFAYLGERKAGKPLERVVFELGDYPDKGYMGPLYLPGWEEGRAKKFICEARGQAAADEGRRFGLCEVVDEDDFYRWDDELPVQAAGMGDMWSFKEERIVREYLAGLTGER